MDVCLHDIVRINQSSVIIAKGMPLEQAEKNPHAVALTFVGWPYNTIRLLEDGINGGTITDPEDAIRVYQIVGKSRWPQGELRVRASFGGRNHIFVVKKVEIVYQKQIKVVVPSNFL